MTAVQYFTACTLDGYIADENNSLDWLFDVPHAVGDGYWDAWFPEVGALVMGATSYEWMIEHDQMVMNPGKWHEYYGDRPGWVFTHRDLPQIPGVQISFVSGDVRPVYEQVAAQLGGANIWLVGGGDLVGQFYDAGLLDQIVLGVTPVTLGKGAPLLPRRITSEHLSFRQARLIGQRVRIVLDIR
ncbi:MAG TPA: dihydrofolate reductase family protein [Streptosporangiaceae bacterium]|nr:dihydrofolate reductase family protein [Streptosporangiaceae bacterium]